MYHECHLCGRDCTGCTCPKQKICVQFVPGVRL
jgi:hypothetical protein